MPTKPAPRKSKPSLHPQRDAADALFRSAKESCHQHERLGRLVSLGADDAEFNAACDLAELCDTQLAERAEQYAVIAADGPGKEPEAWWRAANDLWMACREYARRHDASNGVATRKRRHTAAELGEITMEYELEVSARLGVKQALQSYAKVRPEAT